jgi:hypothetical protein
MAAAAYGFPYDTDIVIFANIKHQSPPIWDRKYFRIPEYVVIQDKLYDTTTITQVPQNPNHLSDNDIDVLINNAETAVNLQRTTQDLPSINNECFDHIIYELQIQHTNNIIVKTLNVANEWAVGNHHQHPNIYDIFKKIVVLEQNILLGGDIIMLQECSPEFLFLIKKRLRNKFDIENLCGYSTIGFGQNKHNVILFKTGIFRGFQTVPLFSFSNKNKGMKTTCDVGSKKLYISNVHLDRDIKWAAKDFYNLFTMDTGFNIIGGDFNLNNKVKYSGRIFQVDIGAAFYNLNLKDIYNSNHQGIIYGNKFFYYFPKITPLNSNLSKIRNNSTFSHTNLDDANDGIFFYEIPAPAQLPAPSGTGTPGTGTGTVTGTPAQTGTVVPSGTPAQTGTPGTPGTPGTGTGTGTPGTGTGTTGGSLNKKIDFKNKYNKYLEKINILLK